MSIEFDPRAKNVLTTPSSTPANETTEGQPADPLDALLNPQTYVSEMELLFSGTHRLKELRQEHPLESINIPGLGSDILGPMPILGNSSQDLGFIIQRYQGLRKNLIERRNNFSHALEGRLRPEEAFDLYERIDQIDSALLKVNQELEKALHRKHQLEERERQKRIETLEEDV